MKPLATLPAQTALDAYFLDIRAKLLDIAAALDRLERGPQTGFQKADPRLVKIAKSLKVLSEANEPTRAEQIQKIFSMEYDVAWKIPEPR
jgi:hypothetical protein